MPSHMSSATTRPIQGHDSIEVCRTGTQEDGSGHLPTDETEGNLSLLTAARCLAHFRDGVADCNESGIASLSQHSVIFYNSDSTEVPRLVPKREIPNSLSLGKE